MHARGFNYLDYTFEAHVRGIKPDKSGLPHVAGEMLSEGLWVGGGEREHLFVLGQRGENPAGESGRKTSQCQPLCVYVNQLTTKEISLQHHS